MSDKGLPAGALFLDNEIGLNYHRYLQRETARHTMYGQYDRMDNDLIASALDVYANEASQRGYNDKVVQVFSNSKFIQDDLFERVGINNYKSWSILRDMCKYGDRFEALKIDTVRGVVGMMDLDPRSVYRIEKNGKLQGFVQDISIIRQQLNVESSATATQNPYINLNTLSVPYGTSTSNISSIDDETDDIVPFLKYELAHFKYRGRGQQAPYGSSVLFSCIDAWKRLDLLLDSIIIYRLNRAPSRLIFYVDVGNNQGADAEAIVQKQINGMNKKQFLDPSTQKINERYQLLDMNANIYIPMQKNSATKVDWFQGASGVNDIEDAKFLNDRLFSALKVPKSFLGFEGDVNNKATLSQQNVTFGKAIQNIQEDFLEALKDICITHLATIGVGSETELKSFSLVMTRPSYIEERARLELENEELGLVKAYIEMGVNRKWAVKTILRKADSEIEEMFAVDPSAQQPDAMGGLGGGIGGGLGGLGGGLEGMDMGAGPEAAAPEMAPAGMGTTPAPSPAPTTATPAPGAPTSPMIQSTEHFGTYLHEGKMLVTSLSIPLYDLSSMMEERKQDISSLTSLEDAKETIYDPIDTLHD
jgi:hypothetical protein